MEKLTPPLAVMDEVTSTDFETEEKIWLDRLMTDLGEKNKRKAIEGPKIPTVTVGHTVWRVVCRDRNGREDVLAFDDEELNMRKVVRNLRKTFPGMEYKLQWKIELELPF